MNIDELKSVCIDHIKWLNGEEGGKRADLRGADLQDANLQDADLRGADLQDANLQDANLQRADLRGADLQDANLQDANLQRADLRGADLQDADLQDADLQDVNLDYSCLPLWCGGSRFKADSKIVRQIIAHVCTIEIVDADDEMRATIAAMKLEAVKSHRASVLGLLGGNE
jgi:uncharacterized protein YjbI with pentapeptide repeats